MLSFQDGDRVGHDYPPRLLTDEDDEDPYPDEASLVDGDANDNLGRLRTNDPSTYLPAQPGASLPPRRTVGPGLLFTALRMFRWGGGLMRPRLEDDIMSA
jgi:hypothetical protein